MKKEFKSEYILLLLLIKKFQLLKSDINIELNDLLLFLNSFYFQENKFTKKNLINFVKEDNNKKIIDFLWAEAITKSKIDEKK